VLVVTATAQSAAATAATTPTLAPEQPGAPAPVVVAPAPPVGAPAAPAPQPSASPSPFPAVPPPSSASPVPAGALASPAPLQNGAASVSAVAGRQTLLECLGERVRVTADPDALPPQTLLTCRSADLASGPPPPPGPVVGDIAFRLDASPNASGTLPKPVTIEVEYPDAAVPAAERDRVVLGRLDGSTWAPVPDQAADPDASSISAIVDRAGVYALYRAP
jgi:hypothetical protein